VPLLGFADPLPARPRRVVVAGTSGAGKTTLARRLAQALDLPHVELDGLFHGPSWTARPTFVADVQRFSAQPGWVTEWQYDTVRPLLAQRCDLVVWLDLPRRTVMRQVSTRTLSRWVRSERLWHGDREPALWRVLGDADHVLRWAWRTHGSTRERVEQLVATRPAVPVVRLRSHREADRWLAGPVARASARSV